MNSNFVFSTAYIDLLAYLIRADNIVHESELEFIYKIINELDITEEEKQSILLKFDLNTELPGFTQILEVIKKEIPKYYLPYIIKELYSVSLKDGIIDKKEVEIIYEVLSVFEVPEDNFPLIQYWALESISLDQKGMELFEN